MLTEIYCIVDDFYKEFEKELPKHMLDKQGRVERRKRSTRLSHSEILTILIFFHCSNYRTFKRFYKELICVFYKNYFNCLVSYNRFIEISQREALPLFIFSSSLCPKKSSGIHFIDSTPLKVCNNRRIYSHKTFKGVAKRGKSSTGWFFGFKLHLIIDAKGRLVNFMVTPGNVSDTNTKVIDSLTQNISGKLFGDKGYISSKLFKSLFKRGIQIITKIKRNMRNCFMSVVDKIILKKRGVIESVIDILKNNFQIEHSRYRSKIGLLLNLFSGIVAYHFRNNKPSIFKKHSKAISQCTY